MTTRGRVCMSILRWLFPRWGIALVFALMLCLVSSLGCATPEQGLDHVQVITDETGRIGRVDVMRTTIDGRLLTFHAFQCPDSVTVRLNGQSYEFDGTPK